MAVEFANSGASAWADPSSAVSLAVPSGVAADDIVIALFYTDGAVTITDLGAFAHAGESPLLVNQVDTSGDHRLNVLWKRATTGDVGSYAFTLSGTTYWSGQAHRFTGCITTGSPWDSAVDSADLGTASANDTPAVSINTTGPNELLVWAATNWGGGAWTPPTGFTLRQDSMFDTETMATKAQAAAGSTGSLVGTCAVSNKTGAWVGALKPPPVASPRQARLGGVWVPTTRQVRIGGAWVAV